MKKYIDTIDLINAYINNTLSKAERLTFENRLETDDTFNTAYEEQLTFIEGIKRTQLTAEINAAKSNYTQVKWLKNIGLSVLVIGLSVLCYNLFSNSEIINEQPNLTIENTINKVGDSIDKKYTVIHKKDATIVDEEQTKNMTLIILRR